MQHANKVLFFIGMSLPLVALLVMSWLVHQTTGHIQESFYQVAHTYKVLNVVQQTQLHLLDAETERRGYLLTSGEDYLTSYGRSMASVRSDIDQLLELSHNNVGQQTNITALQNLIVDRLGIDPDKMSGSKTNLHDALAIALTDQGKNTMEQIGRVLFQMGQDEEYSLGLSQQRAESNAISSQITSVVLIGAVAMALVFIVIILLRLEKLQQVVTICAWTGQVKLEGRWVRLDEYLKRRFGLSVSHGLSREAAEKMEAEIKEFNRPGAAPPPG
ncbi:MAG: CHASE3 domain-containing protein [Verrucomicrobiia bacterium]